VDWFLRPETTFEKILLMVVAIALFVIVVGVIMWLVNRPSIRTGWVVLGFLAPVGVMLTIGLFYPAVRTVWKSFETTRNAVGPNGKGVFLPNGKRVTENVFSLGNYGKIFSEPSQLHVLLNTALWVILVPLLATTIGLVYAVLVDRTRFEKFAKALMFLPMAISMVGASIIWKFVYDYKQNGNQIGLANQLLVWIGLKPYNFLLNSPWNSVFLIFVMVWIQAGFAMTILSAAIKAVPDDIIEAAQIDGATGFKLFRKVTVPSIRPSIVVVLTTIAMTSLKAFDVVRTMTGGQFSTSVVANEFYTQTFRANNAGLGAALAVVLFVIIIPVIVYNVRQMRMSEATR